MSPTLWRRTLAGLAVVPLLALPLVLSAAPDDEKPLGKLPPDLALVPRDAVMFATVRLADAAGDERVKKLLPLLAGPRGGGSVLKQFEDDFGLPVADVERLTVVVRRLDLGGPVWIFRTAKAIDRDAFLKRFDRTDETKAHGKTLVIGHRRGRARAHWMPDDRTLVLSESGPDAVVRHLGALAAGGKTHALADELKAAAGKHTLVVAGRPELAYRMLDAAMRDGGGGRPMLGTTKDKKMMIKEKIEIKDTPPPPPPPRFDVKEKDVVKDKFGGRPGGRTYVAMQLEKDAFRKDAPAFDPDGVKDPPLKLRTLEQIEEDREHFRPEWDRVMRPAYRARRALLTADLGDALTAEARAEYGGEDDVKDAEVLARFGLYLMRELFPEGFVRGAGLDRNAKPVVALIKQFQDAVRKVEVKAAGKALTASATLELDLAPLLKLVAAEMPAKTDSNNLKQLAIAFHAYHDANGFFPAAICDPAGKPLLSWRVAVLPYVEQGPLYAQFKLDEPWDSAHNKKLLTKMPKIYQPVVSSDADPDSTKTAYQVFTGPNTLFPRPNARPRFATIPDGTSNTFLMAESSKPVPWTKPEDMAVDGAAFPKLGGQFAAFLHVAMCDGSVRRVKRKAEERALRLYVDPADGSVVNDRELEP